jgi:hypothetical protein
LAVRDKLNADELKRFYSRVHYNKDNKDMSERQYSATTMLVLQSFKVAFVFWFDFTEEK